MTVAIERGAYLCHPTRKGGGRGRKRYGRKESTRDLVREGEKKVLRTSERSV